MPSELGWLLWEVSMPSWSTLMEPPLSQNLNMSGRNLESWKSTTLWLWLWDRGDSVRKKERSNVNGIENSSLQFSKKLLLSFWGFEARTLNAVSNCSHMQLQRCYFQPFTSKGSPSMWNSSSFATNLMSRQEKSAWSGGTWTGANWAL